MIADLHFSGMISEFRKSVSRMVLEFEMHHSRLKEQAPPVDSEKHVKEILLQRCQCIGAELMDFCILLGDMESPADSEFTEFIKGESNGTIPN